MTREEAILKFTVESDLDDLAPAIVDGLEALGLLKLDEPPKPKSARDILQDCCVSVTAYSDASRTGLLDRFGVDALLHTIDLAGFKIATK